MLTKRRTERAIGAVAAVMGGIFIIASLAFATNGDAAATTAPTVIVGAVASIALLIAAVGLLAHRRWGWRMDVGAHLIGLVAAGLALLGMMSARHNVADGNVIVSGGLLVLVLASLTAIWRARPRRPLRRMSHNIAAKLS
jgi:hypothetical protein